MATEQCGVDEPVEVDCGGEAANSATAAMSIKTAIIATTTRTAYEEPPAPESSSAGSGGRAGGWYWPSIGVGKSRGGSKLEMSVRTPQKSQVTKPLSAMVGNGAPQRGHVNGTFSGGTGGLVPPAIP